MFARTNQLKHLIYSLLLILIVASCRKHKDSVPTPIGPSSQAQTRVTGIVKDQNNQPLSGVKITVNGRIANTGDHGEFNITSSIDGERVYVKAEMSGYFTGTATEKVAADGNTNVQIIMATQVIAATLDASSGGTAEDANGNEVSIPSDGVVSASGGSYYGDVNVSLLHLDPNSPEFGLLTQGADMVATNASGAEGALYSYGVLKVELSDNSGNELQLAPGKTSTVRMAIAPEQLSTAPATIPLWYFDENAGKWVEEGFATKTGNEYVGTVSHFTDWNCDVFSASQATVTGKVVDCSGKPVPFIIIQSGQSYAYTDQDGFYTRQVPSEIAFEIQANSSYWQTGYTSSAIQIPALSAGETYNVPDLALNECVNTVTGTLKGCNGNISGYVEVNGNFGFVEEGTFSVVVASTDSIHIVAYDYKWGFAGKNLAYPVGATTLDAGEFVICMDYTQVGENSFTVDGDVFSNQFISLQYPNDIEDFSFTYGQFRSNGDSVIYQTPYNLYMYSIGYYDNFEQSVVMDFSFYNQNEISLGQYSMNETWGGSFDDSTYLENRTYSYLDFSGSNNEGQQYGCESGTVTITRIDPVGGLIEGTFSGTYRSYGEYVMDPGDSTYSYVPGDKVITVTNGKFSVLRHPDEGNNARIAVSDREAKVMASRKKRHIR